MLYDLSLLPKHVSQFFTKLNILGGFKMTVTEKDWRQEDAVGELDEVCQKVQTSSYK